MAASMTRDDGRASWRDSFEVFALWSPGRDVLKGFCAVSADDTDGLAVRRASPRELLLEDWGNGFGVSCCLRLR